MGKDLEELADAMYFGHEMLRRAEAGESGVSILKSLDSGVSLGAFGPGSKPDHSKLDQSLQVIHDELSNQARYAKVIPTLKEYSGISSVNSLLEEIYQEFPGLKPEE